MRTRMLMCVCSVGSNKLGPAGARYMADALRENSTLQRLERAWLNESCCVDVLAVVTHALVATRVLDGWNHAAFRPAASTARASATSLRRSLGIPARRCNGKLRSPAHVVVLICPFAEHAHVRFPPGWKESTSTSTPTSCSSLQSSLASATKPSSSSCASVTNKQRQAPSRSAE